MKCKLLICEPASAAVFLKQMEVLDIGRSDVAYNLPEHAHHYLVENQGAQLDDLEEHLEEVVKEMTARGRVVLPERKCDCAITLFYSYGFIHTSTSSRSDDSRKRGK